MDDVCVSPGGDLHSIEFTVIPVRGRFASDLSQEDPLVSDMKVNPVRVRFTSDLTGGSSSYYQLLTLLACALCDQHTHSLTACLVCVPPSHVNRRTGCFSTWILRMDGFRGNASAE